MKKLLSTKLLFGLLAFSLITVSCGDDPSSSGPDGEPPETPTFENTQPDLSYFQTDISAESPAYMASVYASSFSSISQIGLGYSSFFSEADRDDADFENGTWVWEYSNSWEGESAQIILEAEEQANETSWSMTMNYNGSEGSQSYTMIEGSVASDGQSGSWRFNTLNEETGEHWPLIETTWSWEDETNGEIITDFFEEGVLQSTYRYVQEGAEFTITMESVNEDNDILIYWNEDSGTGYYQEGDERRCWNENYEETSC